MKKVAVIIVGAAVASAFGLATLVASTYNELAPEDQKVALSYAQVQNVLQRQAELIPNMAEVAKGYATHEESTFREVAAARSKMAEVALLKPSDIANNPELQKKLVDAQQASSSALASLNAVKEAYPQLQANENFKTLMTELAGSQNRITVERMRNQQAVNSYNLKVVHFPGVLVASAIGFGPKPYYQADASSQHAPVLKF